MIGKVSRGSDTAGLLRYLYSPGRANEHTNPHLVASWLGDAPAVLAGLEPGNGPRRFVPLADRLQQPLQLLPATPDRYVWQCSMRLAPGDRQLTDIEWADVARTVMRTTGFAPDGDPGGCRWVAVRHADDHVHVVAILARQDGAQVDTSYDWPKVHAAARELETRLGLTVVAPPRSSRPRRPAPTRGETEKAARHGRLQAYRTWLAEHARAAAAASTNLVEFEHHLTRSGAVVVDWRYSTQNPGQVTGWKVGRIGDVDKDGQQVWFSGSRLGTDLSLPQLMLRWSTSEPTPGRRQPLDLRPLDALLPQDVAAVVHAIRDIQQILRITRRPDPAGRSTLSAAARPQLPDPELARLASVVLQSVDPALAQVIVSDPAWPDLAGALAEVERRSLDAGDCLQAAIRRRELDTAEDVAAVLHHRLTRAPSPTRPPRARA